MEDFHSNIILKKYSALYSHCAMLVSGKHMPYSMLNEIHNCHTEVLLDYVHACILSGKGVVKVITCSDVKWTLGGRVETG